MKMNLNLSLVATFVIAVLSYNVAYAKVGQPLSLKDKGINASKKQEDNVRIFVNNQQRSLYQIALLSGVSVSELREINKGEYNNVDVVKVGDSIVLPASSSLLPAEVKDTKQEDKHSYLPKLGSPDQADAVSTNSNNDEVIERHIATALQTLGQQDWENMTAEKVKEDLKNQSQSYAENYVRGQVRSQLIDPVRSAAQDFLGRFGTAQLQFDVSDQAKLNNVNLKLFSPWYDSDNMLLFSQLTYQEYEQDRRIANFGIGQRWDVADKSWLLGYNVFFDHDLTRNHNRLGLGLEAWSDYMKFAANYYTPLSDWKDSKDFDNYLERAARGYDVRFQGYLPSYPHLGASLMFEQYFGDKVALFGKDKLLKDPYAVTVGVDYTPVPLFTIKGEHKQGEGSSKMAKVELTMNYRIGVPVKDQLDPNMVDVARSLKGSRYDLVDRNNFIVLEYKEKKFSVDINFGVPGIVFDEGSTVPVNINVHNAKGALKPLEWNYVNELTEMVSAGGQFCWNSTCWTSTSNTLSFLQNASNGDTKNWSIVVPPYVNQATGFQNPKPNKDRLATDQLANDGYYTFSLLAKDSNSREATSNTLKFKIAPLNRKVLLDTPTSATGKYTITGHLGKYNTSTSSYDYFHDEVVFNEYKSYVDKYNSHNTITSEMITYLNKHWIITNGTSVGLMADGVACDTQTYKTCLKVEGIAASTAGNQDDYTIIVSVGTVKTGDVDVQLELGEYDRSEKETIEVRGTPSRIELWKGATLVGYADNSNSFIFNGTLTTGDTYGVKVLNVRNEDITPNVSVLLGLVGDNKVATDNTHFIDLGTPSTIDELFTVAVNDTAIADTNNKVPTNRSRVETTCGYDICYTIRGVSDLGSIHASYISDSTNNGTTTPHKGLQGNNSFDNSFGGVNGSDVRPNTHAGDQGYHLMVWVE